ncbi:GLRA3 [Branchiostoma lanceolatum]|nr:GLRA3 [Branchiostoma lanceolatum]
MGTQQLVCLTIIVASFFPWLVISTTSTPAPLPASSQVTPVTQVTTAVGVALGNLTEWERWQAFRSGQGLPGNYSKAVRPNSEDRWTDVLCGIRMSDVGSLSHTTMKFEASFDLTLEWRDPRLAGMVKSTTPIPSTMLWTPALSFGKKVQVLTDGGTGNEEEGVITAWVMPDGTIANKKRYDVKIKCAMDLKAYPVDNQQCSFQFHGLNGALLRLKPTFEWRSDVSLTTDITSVHSAFSVNHVQIRAFANSFLDESGGKGCSYQTSDCEYAQDVCAFEDKGNSECERYEGSCRNIVQQCALVSTKSSPNTYTTIEMTLKMSRLRNYHLMEIYIPSITIVCLSWVAFWINRAAVPARVALGITTVLTMVTQSTRVVGMPQVSYVRAIDVWALSCQTFVFLALVEYALVNYLGGNQKPKDKPSAPPAPKRSQSKNSEKMNNLDKNIYPNLSTKDVNIDTEDRPSSRENNWMKMNKTSSFSLKVKGGLALMTTGIKKDDKNDTGARIDKAARVLFPTAFIIFNLVYWLWYVANV